MIHTESRCPKFLLVTKKLMICEVQQLSKKNFLNMRVWKCTNHFNLIEMISPGLQTDQCDVLWVIKLKCRRLFVFQRPFEKKAQFDKKKSLIIQTNKNPSFNYNSPINASWVCVKKKKSKEMNLTEVIFQLLTASAVINLNEHSPLCIYKMLCFLHRRADSVRFYL